MKVTLDEDSRRDLIEYRLQRSNETLEEADYNAKGGYYNSTVNRLYYACYYSAAALMLCYGLEASTHAGIKSMLGMNFIKAGVIEAKYGRIYQQLFENRQSGDYEDFVYCDQELYDALRPQAQEFVVKVTNLIHHKH